MAWDVCISLESCYKLICPWNYLTVKWILLTLIFAKIVSITARASAECDNNYDMPCVHLVASHFHFQHTCIYQASTDTCYILTIATCTMTTLHCLEVNFASNNIHCIPFTHDLTLMCELLLHYHAGGGIVHVL